MSCYWLNKSLYYGILWLLDRWGWDRKVLRERYILATNLRCITSKKSEGLYVILSSDVTWPIGWNKRRYMSNEKSLLEHMIIRLKWFSLCNEFSEKHVVTFCSLTPYNIKPVARPLNLFTRREQLLLNLVCMRAAWNSVHKMKNEEVHVRTSTSTAVYFYIHHVQEKYTNSLFTPPFIQ